MLVVCFSFFACAQKVETLPAVQPFGYQFSTWGRKQQERLRTFNISLVSSFIRTTYTIVKLVSLVLQLIYLTSKNGTGKEKGERVFSSSAL